MATALTFAPHALSGRAVIALSGDRVLAFLHNILTCSVEELNQGQMAYGALLSPQGKILHDVFVHHGRESVLLDCAETGRDDLIAKLKLYRLRARFEIAARDDLDVVAGVGAADPRLAALPMRGLVPKGRYTVGAAYDDLRYELGVADSTEIGSGSLFPHEANFDVLKAVDFDKGCYIGQEVVSRMQHRGTARSRIMPITLADDQPISELRTGETLVGEVLGRRGRRALALLKLDRSSGALPFALHRPDWMPHDSH